MDSRFHWRALALAVFMTAAGVTHFLQPRAYERIMPRALPQETHRPLVYASGVAEIAVAAMTALPQTRLVGALATEGLLIAVFPANVQMALDSGNPRRTDLANNPWVAWGRLPLQIPLVLWAHGVWRRERGRAAAGLERR